MYGVDLGESSVEKGKDWGPTLGLSLGHPGGGKRGWRPCKCLLG